MRHFRLVQQRSTLNRLLIVAVSFTMMYILSVCRELEPSTLELYTTSDVLIQTEHLVYPKGTEQVDVTISNKMDRDTFFAPFFTQLLMETEESGRWYSIPWFEKYPGTVRLRKEAAVIIHANDEIFIPVRFDEYDYHFKAGNYRVIAEVHVYPPNSQDGKDVLISCEFQLSDSRTMIKD